MRDRRGEGDARVLPTHLLTLLRGGFHRTKDLGPCGEPSSVITAPKRGRGGAAAVRQHLRGARAAASI